MPQPSTPCSFRSSPRGSSSPSFTIPTNPSPNMLLFPLPSAPLRLDGGTACGALEAKRHSLPQIRLGSAGKVVVDVEIGLASVHRSPSSPRSCARGPLGARPLLASRWRAEGDGDYAIQDDHRRARCQHHPPVPNRFAPVTIS